MIEDLLLFQKAYAYFVWVFPLVGKFPKNQRFVLGQHIELECLALLQTMMQFQISKTKKECIASISLHFDMLQLYMRLAKDLRFISIRQYGVSAEKLNELGRIWQGLTKRFL
jgi:hypothetical protein